MHNVLWLTSLCPSVYRRGRLSGMDFIRRGADNVFMDVSYHNPSTEG